MTIENDFLPYSTAAGANVLSQASYLGNASVPAGVSSGILPSNFLNKAIRQGSIAAYLIGQLIVDETGQTALDNGAAGLPTLLAEFKAAIGAAASTLGAQPIPGGRLTLSTGVPVLNSAVIGATSVIYTPFQGNKIPVWSAALSAFIAAPFAEISQALSDATLSPAAAVAASVYDLFVWSNAGTIVVSRGPAWTNATTRSLALTRVNGLLVNSAAITNGPASQIGIYVGTIATDPGGATVSFNPLPAAASGGPSGGASIGLWNFYGRKLVSAAIGDNNSWTYNSATFRPADNSTNNRITFVSGIAEDGLSAIYAVDQGSATASQPFIGIAVNSVTAPLVAVSAMVSVTSGADSSGTGTVNAAIGPQIGQVFIQAMEAVGSGTATFNGTSGTPSAQLMQLSAQLQF
jgi:hypothetical protein